MITNPYGTANTPGVAPVTKVPKNPIPDDPLYGTQQKGMSTEELDLIIKKLGPGGEAPVFDTPGLEEKQRLAFARAKDRTGKVGRASLTGLRESMAARGLMGNGQQSSGIERGEERRLHGDVAGNLSNVVSQQAAEDVESKRRAAEANFAAQREAAGRKQQYTEALLGLIRSAGGLYEGPRQGQPSFPPGKRFLPGDGWNLPSY